MLNPQIPPAVGPLAQFTNVVLRSLLTATHYGLGQKLPLPEADREQWCMRLDSAIQAQNQLAPRAAICTEYSEAMLRRATAAGTTVSDACANLFLVIDGKRYSAVEAMKLSASIRGRAYQGMQEILSNAALLILDERANAARAANPVTCVVTPFVLREPVDAHLPEHQPIPESENVAAIRIEREQGVTVAPPTATGLL